MMKTLKRLLILGLALLFITSCKKYADGGLVCKAEKRLTKSTWKLERYFRNGNDESGRVLISNFTEQYKKGGEFVRSYTDKDGNAFSETGTWEFDNNKARIKLTGISSIELTLETGTVSTSEYNILNLRKKDFWYYYENGGDRHEFRLVPN